MNISLGMDTRARFVLMESGGLYSSFYKMQFKEESGIVGDSALAETSSRLT